MTDKQDAVATQPFDERERMAGLDVLTSIVLFVTGGGIAYFSWTMKIFNRMRMVSPGLFPFILGLCFMFLGVLMGILAVRRRGIPAARYLLRLDHLGKCVSSSTFRRGGIVFLSILIYVLLFGRINFVAITACYLLFSFLYLKALKPPYAVLLSVGAAFAVYCAFRYGFGIPIP